MDTQQSRAEHWRLARELEGRLRDAVDANNALAQFERETPFDGPPLVCRSLSEEQARRWRAGLDAVDTGQSSLPPSEWQG